MTNPINLPSLAEAIHLAAASATLSMTVPVAEIGTRPGSWADSSGGDPWTATIGSTSVSNRSDPRRRLELALEHLVAAATIPSLVASHDAHLAELDRLYLRSPDALAILDYAKQEMGRIEALTEDELAAGDWFDWVIARGTDGAVIEARESHDRWRAVRDKEIENERMSAFEDGRYVAKRQAEIPAELGWAKYDKLDEPLRAAVDHLIEKEITK